MLHGVAVETDTTYLLDRVGNRVVRTVRDGAAVVTKTVAGTFDERDRLTGEATTGAGAGTLVLGYDANGSLTTSTKDGGLQSTRGYDARGRLAAMLDGSGATIATYRYTADGLRAGQTEGVTTTLYLVDALSPSGYAQVVEERTAAGVLVSQFVYGLGLDPVSMSRDLNGSPASLEPAVYLADGHSGVRQAVDLNGSVLAAYRYDAFGATASDAQRAGGLVNPVGYRGERYDAALGNYALRARHYDPRSGRFTSADPEPGNYEDVLQAMRYGYAGANPVANKDPSGRDFGFGGFGGGLTATLGGRGSAFGGGDLVGFGSMLGGALGCPGVAAFRGMMGLPFGMVLGAAVGFYGEFLAGFADALADDPNVSYNELIQEAVWSGIEGAIEGALAFAGLGMGGACFTAGTPLLTPDGTKGIEQFRCGDLVLSRAENDQTGVVESRVVEEVFARYARVLHLTVGGERIGTTAEHPFYVRGRGWTAAGDLLPGDVLVGHDGQDQAVHAKEAGGWMAVYNLRVADHHTYFVGCSEWGFSVWAHNDSCSDKLGKAMRAASRLPRAATDIAAHVVPVLRSGTYKRGGPGVEAAIKKAQKILDDAGIGLNSATNGFWAPNRRHQGTHRDKYFLELAKRLGEAADKGSAAVLKELKKIRG